MQSGSDISQLTTVYCIYKIVHPCSINVEFMLLYIYLKLCEVLNNLKTFFNNSIWWLEFILFFLNTLMTNHFFPYNGPIFCYIVCCCLIWFYFLLVFQRILTALYTNYN